MQLSKKDLAQIIEAAKDKYSTMAIPYYLNGEAIEGHQCTNLAVVIATIGFLNSKGLLSEQIKTDFLQSIKHDGE